MSDVESTTPGHVVVTLGLHQVVGERAPLQALGHAWWRLVLREARLDVDCSAPTRAAVADVGPSWRSELHLDVRRFRLAVRTTS